MKFLGTILILISVTCASVAFWQYFTAHPSTPAIATILANRIHQTPILRSNDQITLRYQADLLLEYQFAGKTSLQWVAEPTQSFQRSRIEILLGHRCPGTRLTIYLDPKHPDKPALSLPASQDSKVTTLLSVFLALTGTLLLTLSLKNQQSPGNVVYLS